MRAFLLVLRKDLLRRLRSPLAPLIFLAFPVVFSLLIGMAFGRRGGEMAPIQVALVDEDRGFLARLVRSSFAQDQASQRFDVRAVDRAEGVRLVEDGEVSAMVAIPAGFSDSLFAVRPTRLEVLKNPAEGIYPQIVEQYVEVLAQVGGAGARLLGEPMGRIRGAVQDTGRVGDAFVADVSIAINRRMDRIGRYAFPPAIRLERDGERGAETGEAASSSTVDVTLFVLPGMAVFALLALALGSMADFQRERVHATLPRQLVAPVRIDAVILGKMAGVWVLSLLCIAILALLGRLWFGKSASLSGFVALSVAFALAATGFAAAIQSLTRSERTSSMIGTILNLVMAMAGGSFIPVEQLGAIRPLAPFTLNYWGNEGYRRLLMESAGIGDLLPNLAVLLGIGVVLSAVAIRRFRALSEAGA